MAYIARPTHIILSKKKKSCKLSYSCWTNIKDKQWKPVPGTAAEGGADMVDADDDDDDDDDEEKNHHSREKNGEKAQFDKVRDG